MLLLVSGCGTRESESDQAELLRRGDAFVAAKQYRAAADVYRVAVQIDPRNGETRLKLADALWQAQDWSAGALEGIRAADLLPGNPSAQLLGASRALALSRFSEAAARVSRVLDQQPNNVEALIVLGNATAQIRCSVCALDFLRTRARRDEMYETALRDVRPLTSSNDDAKAEQILRHALELAPGAYETREALVNFLWAVGRPDDAADLLRQLADEVPWHLVVNHALAEYYISRGKVADGERYLKNAAASGNREIRLELVEFYIAADRDTDALAVLDGFSDDEPPGSVSLPRAAIECRQGQRDAALRRIDRVLERSPRHGTALQLRAECLLGMARLAEALESARAAVAAAPASAGTHFALAQALSASGALDNAFAELTEAVRLDPMHRPASRSLARHALEIGRPETAVVLLRELVRADATDKDSALMLVKALILLHETAAAAAALEPLVTRFPGSAEVLVRQGDLHVARGTPGGRMSYERALTLDPDSLDALTGLVSLDLAEKQPAVARQRVERALVRYPDHPEYLLLLGQVLQHMGDSARSEAVYRKVIALSPGHVRASVRLAALLERQQRNADARMILEQLLERRPAAAEARVALATLLEDAGRMSEAQAHYEQVLADDPRAAVAAYKLASVQVEQGENLDVALSLAVTAVQALPNDPGATDALGWIHVRKNLPHIGLRYLESSVRAAPENSTYRYHLGVAYIAIGQREKGRTELSRALALNPAFRFAAQARAMLDPTLR
jgi:tetratricopeptide (TPR) repeat protein